jgi:polyhydroxyalkanoate synthesis regulator protein
MLAAMGKRNSIHMARVTRLKATKCFAIRRLCSTGTGTSVMGEGLADVVLATLSPETAAQITRSVLQQTTRRHVRHG